MKTYEGFTSISDEHKYIEHLSPTEKQNAILLKDMLLSCGWSLYGIAGFFSAVEFESRFDPALIESFKSESYLRSHPNAPIGAGLIQWTNGYKQLIKFCDEWGIDWKLPSSQVRKLELERTSPDSNIRQYFPTIKTYRNIWNANFQNDPPASMTAYVKATPDKWSYLEMAAAWVLFYTRPASFADKAKWQRNADCMKSWYVFLQGHATPNYVCGRTYTLKANMNVRTRPGTQFPKVPFENLTEDGKRHAFSNGVLKKGTEVTCLDVKEKESEIWICIPSGWVCGYLNGEVYI